MPDIPASFSGLKITNYYKYILYVAGVILILSLFVDAKGVDNERLRNISLWVVISGLGIWLLADFIGFVDDYMCYLAGKYRMSRDDYEFWSTCLFWGFVILQVFVWILVLFLLIL